MKNLILVIVLSILSSTLYAEVGDLFNENYLPADTKIEVTLKKVELAPFLNDYNLFFLGDNDFEMIVMLNGLNREIEFPLKANRTKYKKPVNLNLSFRVQADDLNYAIGKRRDYDRLSDDAKRIIQRGKIGQLCLLDDSLLSPGFITTSFYGCLDLAYIVQKMVSNKMASKNVYVKHNTTFPVSNDPKKEKLFKSWYTIKIVK